MGFEVDEEILQDFLVEAGEILEQLQEQLVELENNPENADLLNAIFRGFHTVKGGAGFLSLAELVDACHGAENVFDVLRQGKRQVTPELMDVILQALDSVNGMFTQVQNGEQLTAADPEIIEALHRLSSPDEDEPAVAAPIADDMVVDPEVVEAEQHRAEGGIEEISEDEFEALLDELHGPGGSPTDETAGGNDGDITDDEFEALLDQLHGKGQHSGQPVVNVPAASIPAGSGSSRDDEISDDEFEALLDQLHGQGRGPALDSAAAKSPADAAKAVAKPAAGPVAKSEPAKTQPAKAAVPATAAQAKEPVKAPLKAPAKPPAPAAETTVRVDTARLDQIMNMVGELVLVRNRLVSLVGASRDDEALSKAVANLDVVTADLQGGVMKTRMQPIKKVFGRFPRVVRDLARSLKKEINLVLEGEETDLDKNLVEALADPLVHLVRNSVDHGIELPEVREAAGKPRCGTVKLSASQEGDHILLTIEDDGAGMNAEKLKQIAISRGVLDEDGAARMSDAEAYNLIFAPGFSTKVEISDISGRGVGMDVVKTKITQLNGSVRIDSVFGVGTTLEIKVPLTLAILPTLMVMIGKQTFALPLAAVNEIFHLDLTKTNVVDGQLTIIVRKKAIPLFYLDEWLLVGSKRVKRSGNGHVVIVQQGNQQIGFVVDSLIGQEEVVIKPLGALLHGTPGMAGATITSDGGIALILDVPGLLKNYAKK